MSKFVALNEADVKDSESGVRIDMLPLAGSMPAYLDTERLEVDVGTIGEICKLSRIQALVVGGVYEHEEAPEIGEVDSKGRAAISTVQKVYGQRAEPGRSGRNVYGISNADHAVDFTAEQLRVNFQPFLNSEGRNIRDLEQWARVVRKNLKRELWKIAKEKHGFSQDRFFVELLSPLIVSLGVTEEPSALARQLINSIAINGCFFATIFTRDVNYIGLMYAISLLSLNNYVRREIKSMADTMGVGIKYDPATLLTVGQFEWDRLLRVGISLMTKDLVRVAVEGDGQKKL